MRAVATPSHSKPIDLDELRARRDELIAIAARRQARHIRVFGSVARREQRPGSDVDFLVAFEAGASLLDQVHLIDDLAEALGTPVDVIGEGGLLDRDDHIRREAVAL